MKDNKADLQNLNPITQNKILTEKTENKIENKNLKQKGSFNTFGIKYTYKLFIYTLRAIEYH